MKKLIRTFLVAGLALTSCNNNEPKIDTTNKKQEQTDPKQEFAKLDEFLKKFEEPSQSFKAPTDKPIKVIGKEGTIIHINPADLETESGQTVGKEISIELKELSNQQQLLRANAQTVSDGQLLVSGGAYYLNVTSSGEKVKLKNGKRYSVEFPKLANDEMSLYYGQRDSSGKMNWKRAEKKFESKAPAHSSPKQYEAVIVADGMRDADTARIPLKSISKEEAKKMEQEAKINAKKDEEIRRIAQEEKLKEKVYNPISLTQFGWINCDRLFPKAPRVKIEYTISNKEEDVNYIKVYLIFKDIKSVMQDTYYSYNGKIEKYDFNNIPTGMTVRFLAVCYQHQKVFATLTNTMQVTEKLNENLLLQEINETDFDKLMKSVE